MRSLPTILVFLASFLLLAGCEYEPRMHMDVPGMQPLKIQLLGFEGCPGAEVFMERIEVAVEQGQLLAEIEYVDLNTLSLNDPRRGWGSPTILVDGSDLYGQHLSATTGMNCRLYPDGWPTSDQLTGELLASR
ncbi:MAG: hypothetical protein VX527_09785 [Planctomycetota bacterium]|nr:hypothetical protein [Planctomycetota bacterium]